MKIEGIELCCVSEWDGLPIKNHLPIELKDRLKTEEQWFDEGYVLKDGAAPYKMHPSFLAKRTFLYYLDTDVQPVS